MREVALFVFLTLEFSLSPVPALDAQFLCLELQSIVGLDDILELLKVLKEFIITTIKLKRISSSIEFAPQGA